MPTFKNETTHYIDYEQGAGAKRILLRFKPDEERALPFWLPYQKLGLTLVNADYPAVPNSILISGNFNFDKGTERRFNIEPCDSYIVNINIQKGKIGMYPGNSGMCVEISDNYKATLSWDYTPYIKIVGLENTTTATIHAEVYRE